MIRVAVGILLKDRTVLLCQRKSTARYPLKWEFPGGKLNEGESAEHCLRRELAEELGIEADVGLLYHEQRVVYPDSGSFEVFYYTVPAFQGKLSNRVFEAYAWVPLSDLPSYDILQGNREVIDKILADDEIHRSS